VSLPLVSVVTPTWQRRELLLNRCIPSVQAQGYSEIEHLVVGDGPDEVLRKDLAEPWLRGWRNLWYKEFPVREPGSHYGHLCRREGLEFAAGAYITYVDDDDALRPLHCGLLAAALDEHPEAGFAVSRMVSHGPGGACVIGHGELACGNVGTPQIMHRKEIAEVATWDHAGQFEDWDLVLAWINAGIRYVRVDAETSDVWPSVWHGNAQ
jgi:glycosyltransferase involved in cell wall biosynthesis